MHAYNMGSAIKNFFYKEDQEQSFFYSTIPTTHARMDTCAHACMRGAMHAFHHACAHAAIIHDAEPFDKRLLYNAKYYLHYEDRSKCAIMYACILRCMR